MERKINSLRDQLHKLVKSNASYRDIYKLSIRLDVLIVQYYKQNLNLNKAS